jgi:hypothetical protein
MEALGVSRCLLCAVYSAREVLLESVQAYPLNWSAWLDLAEVCIEHATGPAADGSDPLSSDVVEVRRGEAK